MVITLFGYPKTGKTTLFNLLTGADVQVSAFEEGRREPSVRSTPVPDGRLDAVAALYPERRKVQVSCDLVDLVGISFGEVKASLFLSHLRRADGLVHVVRGFRDALLPHPRGRIDPAEDIRVMEEELVLTDLLLIDARLEKLDKDLGKMKDPEGEKERALLARVRPALEAGRPLREAALTPVEAKLLRSFAFLSRKPLLHMINLDERDTAFLDRPEALIAAGPGRDLLAFSGRIESEIRSLPEDEKSAFLAGFGIQAPSPVAFWRKVLGWLGRIAFYTIGKDEVRAWSVDRDTPAAAAAGAIHSDIERGFIRAEVVPWDELLRAGAWSRAKETGAVRLEGRDYPVRDGDVVFFRFSA